MFKTTLKVLEFKKKLFLFEYFQLFLTYVLKVSGVTSKRCYDNQSQLSESYITPDPLCVVVSYKETHYFFNYLRSNQMTHNKVFVYIFPPPSIYLQKISLLFPLSFLRTLPKSQLISLPLLYLKVKLKFQYILTVSLSLLTNPSWLKLDHCYNWSQNPSLELFFN